VGQNENFRRKIIYFLGPKVLKLLSPMKGASINDCDILLQKFR
jgi:hypothetical protein